MTNSIYTGLKLVVGMINRNFRIKVSGIDETGKRLNTLLGVSGLINLKITFYVK